MFGGVLRPAGRQETSASLVRFHEQSGCAEEPVTPFRHLDRLCFNERNETNRYLSSKSDEQLDRAEALIYPVGTEVLDVMIMTKLLEFSCRAVF